MQFVITAHDGENVLEKRMAVRPRHLEELAQLGSKVVFAGGMLDDAGLPKGSVLVMEFESRAELDAYLAREPYVEANVWADIQVTPIKTAILKGEKLG